MDDIVTVRASCDCYFQIFLSHGKILQFRADNMESQAYWMALIKVGLGRGEREDIYIYSIIMLHVYTCGTMEPLYQDTTKLKTPL